MILPYCWFHLTQRCNDFAPLLNWFDQAQKWFWPTAELFWPSTVIILTHCWIDLINDCNAFDQLPGWFNPALCWCWLTSVYILIKPDVKPRMTQVQSGAPWDDLFWEANGIHITLVMHSLQRDHEIISQRLILTFYCCTIAKAIYEWNDLFISRHTLIWHSCSSNSLLEENRKIKM